MKLNCITGLLFAAALASVFVLGSAQSLSCAGSTLCHFLPQSDCDAAERGIVAGNTYFTGSSSTETGVCSGHCGIFVQGSDCSVSGQQMIDAFNALRNYDCQKCGIYTLSNGCQIKVDYVTGC